MRLLPLLLLFICCSVRAEWALICNGDTNDHFFDETKVSEIGNNRRVWVLVNFHDVDNSKGAPVASIVNLSEYSCKESRSTTLQQDWFSEKWARGKVLTPRGLSGAGKWEFLVPGSCGEAIMKKICSK